MSLSTIYTTFPTLESASEISRILVREGLIACANIIPQAVSIYVWENSLHESPEVIALLKTPSTKAEEATSRLITLHPYDIPCASIWEAAQGNPAFFDWAEAQTSSHSSPPPSRPDPPP